MLSEKAEKQEKTIANMWFLCHNRTSMGQAARRAWNEQKRPIEKTGGIENAEPESEARQ